jgi:hypothetical protein
MVGKGFPTFLVLLREDIMVDILPMMYRGLLHKLSPLPQFKLGQYQSQPAMTEAISVINGWDILDQQLLKHILFI